MNPAIVFLATSIFALAFTFSQLVSASTADLSSSSSLDTTSKCVTFDLEERMITINCETANLPQINGQIKNTDVIRKDANVDKGWILNAGITVAQNATLYINSSDASWLKILADGDTAYPILVSGSLKIDSAKITSWNPNTNNYTSSEDSHRNGEDVQIGTPRPYIVVNDDATGTTDITNSEIAYLGYESGYGGGRTGLRYEGGDGSIVSGNNIHDLYFAFYSKGVGGMKVEGNHIHDNIHYGLDPHTETHDMSIKNNTVHDNGSIGIICSLDCYNIVIEDNKVFNNTKMGIMFSRNMFDSVARNNFVGNEENGIVISESHNNEIYNNTVSDSGSGIDIDEDSFENLVYNNTIVNIPDPSEAMYLRDGASEQNTLHSNTLGINGQRMSLDEVEITGGAEDSSENNAASNGDEGDTDSSNDSGDGEGESDSNNDGE
ncbi:MAG: right-handed parallel beta-helix repeat-containing protein [Ignavibacteriales bacterium]